MCGVLQLLLERGVVLLERVKLLLLAGELLFERGELGGLSLGALAGG